MPPRQYSLRELFVVVSFACLLSAGIHWLGWGWMLRIGMAFGVFSAVVTLWGAAYVRAPQAAKLVTVVGICGLTLLSLLSMGLLQSREAARRLQCENSMRLIAEERLLLENLNPQMKTNPPGAPADLVLRLRFVIPLSLPGPPNVPPPPQSAAATPP